MAVQGANHHGKEYAEHARRQGAFVLCEEEGDLIISDAHKVLSLLVNYFYDEPAQKMFVIGVTGTNGKTTTTTLLKEMLSSLGKKCARIGTDKIEMMDDHRVCDHTTPAFMENLHLFLEAVDLGIEVMIMEISSHAIHESRIGFIRFDRMVYTNVAFEHLDYHQTFAHYRYTKFKARHYLKKEGWIVMNYDCEWLQELIYLHPHHLLTFGHKGHIAMKNIQLSENKSAFEIKEAAFVMKLIGMVNVYNAVCSLAVLYSMGYDLSLLAEKLAYVQGAEGRMEVLKIQNKVVLIDYAHSVDAIDALLLFARTAAKGKIITVLGCGGERDKKKRPLMAKLAAMHSDTAIFTEDNSRNEHLDDILKDMNYQLYPNVRIEKKRTDAIQLALALAQDGDMIIIAGKGNEHFIIAGEQKIPYNDKAYLIQFNKGEK